MNILIQEPSSRRRFARFKRDRWRTADDAAANGPAANAADQPGEAAGGAAKKRRFLREYLRWLAPWRGALASVFVLALLSMAFEMVMPLATRRIIDGILLAPGLAADERRTLLHAAGGVVIGALLLSQGIEAWRAYRVARLNARIIYTLRQSLFERLIHLPLGELGEMKSGGIVSRLSSDASNVNGLAQMAVISPGVALTKVLLTLGILISINPVMAGAAALMLFPITWLSIQYVMRARPIYRSMADDRAAIDGRIGEVFGGIRVVRGFRRERRERLEYGVSLHTVIRKDLYWNRLVMLVDMGWALLIPVTGLIIVWLGGILYLRDQTTIGDIVAFQMYSGMLLWPVWRIVSSINETQRALASMERVFEVLSKPASMPDRPGAAMAPARVDRLTLDRVTFGYRPDRPVITDLSLEIPGGSTVALVGPSGAGKTTLTDLLARFHDPQTGAVRLNGIDLRDFQLGSYRRLLGIVQQDVFLFDGTIADNIAYGCPGATREAIATAAARANAHQFIRDFPEGYDTLIGERGLRLSGGQKQRVSIARAILADPRILILDEATSNLDSESEELIQAALRELFRDRTTVVIAHRLSTITHADRIVVVEAGRIVEQGGHEELLRRAGRYAAMVERQRRSFSL